MFYNYSLVDRKPLSKKEKDENAEDDKFERLKDYDSWTNAEYKELCSKLVKWSYCNIYMYHFYNEISFVEITYLESFCKEALESCRTEIFTEIRISQTLSSKYIITLDAKLFKIKAIIRTLCVRF